MEDNTLPIWMFDSLPAWVTNEKKLTRWRILQQIKLFRLNQKVKKGEYVYRNDFHEYLSEIVSIAEDMLKNKLSEAQIEYIISLESREDIEYFFNQRMLALLWEIIYSKKSYEKIKKMFNGHQESIKYFFKMMKASLGFEYLPNATTDIEKCIAWYRNEIITALETSEDEIRYILDEVKSVCEHDNVLSTIQGCTYSAILPERDRKKIYREKEKFQKMKEETIKNLKTLGIAEEIIKEIEQKEHISNEQWENRESTIRHIKTTLYETLVLICGTGKKRAKEITKILKYL